MTRNDELNNGHRNGAGGSILQVDGAGNGKEGKKGTPKKETPKKGSRARRSTPATPKRRGLDGGRGAANAATRSRSIQSSTTIGGTAYTTEVGIRRVTDISDIYTGPAAAAFTTLRREGSVSFKALLQRLKEASRQTVPRRPVSGTPQLTVPEQDPQANDVPENSPADSGIDVLTPASNLGLVENNTQQSTQEVENMAPVREISQAERDRLRERNQQVEVVSESLKDVIHNYYEVQAQVQGYVSETETRDVLVNKMQELSQSLDHLARASSSSTITNTFVPPEVVDYVDDGRNPDIYRRELVEVVQRGNAVLNGKMNAFGSFSTVFAADLRKMSPEMAKAVDEIMGVNGDGAELNVKQENGGSHQA